MITPKLYAWKGAKWIRKIEFLAEDKKGLLGNPRLLELRGALVQRPLFDRVTRRSSPKPR
jgi:DMSO/TMAO reductase YedYZ molybdopterin-dependent catalytic subunit